MRIKINKDKETIKNTKEMEVPEISGFKFSEKHISCIGCSEFFYSTDQLEKYCSLCKEKS